MPLSLGPRARGFPVGEEALPKSFCSGEAARESAVAIGDKTFAVFHINAKLLAGNPDKWHASRRLLKIRARRSNSRNCWCAKWAAGRHESQVPRAPAADPFIGAIRRCESFPPRRWALPPGAETARGASCFGSLRIDADDHVKEACAVALRGRREAPDSAVADLLVGRLDSDGPSAVRCGVARGLAKAAVSRSAVREVLERHLMSGSESADVRITCAWALETQLAGSRDFLPR